MTYTLSTWNKHLDAIKTFYQETRRSALVDDAHVSKAMWVKEANDELATIKRKLGRLPNQSYNGIRLDWWRPLQEDDFDDLAGFADKEHPLAAYKPNIS